MRTAWLIVTSDLGSYPRAGEIVGRIELNLLLTSCDGFKGMKMEKCLR